MGAYLQSCLPKLYSMSKMFEENSSNRISKSKLPTKGIVRVEETSHSPKEGKNFMSYSQKKENLKEAKL